MTQVASYRLACQCGATTVVPAPIGGRRTACGWKISTHAGGWTCPSCQRMKCAECPAVGDVPTDADWRDKQTVSGWKICTRRGQRGWRCATCAGKKQLRGFASMSAATQKRIASWGGRSAHRKGTAHTWTKEEAAAAGRKGGKASNGGRGKAVAA